MLTHAQRMHLVAGLPDRTAPLEDRLLLLSTILDRLGFDNALDAFLVQVENTPVELKPSRSFQVAEMRRLFHGGTIARAIHTFCSHPYTQQKQFSDSLRDVPDFIVSTSRFLFAGIKSEFEALCTAARKPAKSFSPQDITDFDMKTLKAMAMTIAPLFWQFLSAIVIGNTAGGERNKEVMLAFSLFHMAYIKSRMSSLLPSNITYLMNSFHAGKRLITIFNGLGLCISYDSSMIMTTAIGDGLAARLQEMVRTSRPVMNFDNADYMSRVKTDTLHKMNTMTSDTVGFVYFPEGSKVGLDLLPATSVDHAKISHLVATHLLPTIDQLEFLRNQCPGHMTLVLEKYHEDVIGLLFPDTKAGRATKPKIVKLNELPVERTEIFVLPALPLNEAKTDECLQIADTYVREMGLDSRRLENHKIITKGDLRTVNTMASGLYLRQDCVEASDRLDFLEPLPSLFHMDYAMSKLMNAAYWGEGSGKDPCSIAKFVSLSGNNKVKKEAKDYRSTGQFQSDATDAGILSAIYRAFNVRSKDEFNNRVRDGTITGTAVAGAMDSISKTIFDIEGMKKRRMLPDGAVRPTSDPYRDILNENVTLMMRDFMVVREFKHAVRSGDIERICNVLFYWSLLLQGSAHTKYAAVLVEITAGLRVLWTDEFREHFLRSMLVNPSGTAGGWLADDMFCEWLVREYKDMINARAWTNGIWTRADLTRQISLMQMNRLRWVTMLEATDYGQHSAESVRFAQVQMFQREFTSNRAWYFTAGRNSIMVGGAVRPISVVIDLYTRGAKRMHTGKPIRLFKDRAHGSWRTAYKGSAVEAFGDDDDAESSGEDGTGNDDLYRMDPDRDEDTDDIIQQGFT
ncbi:hypothetical protein BJ508DRAFT_314996 [Ascobolus immersus RN42]|uniref:DUF6589 domain-containing protein n=1 Tax=Ascobolus immersus RN42 TaxID=1160509 RepID=A0A3N4HH35_ASCIM|nr:hypothetical protein BJ508DRAFT_314996 [Ascobolus immersus RN42]